MNKEPKRCLNCGGDIDDRLESKMIYTKRYKGFLCTSECAISFIYKQVGLPELAESRQAG